MTTTSSKRIAVGDSLPRVSFPLVGAVGEAMWNQGTQATVIFVVHGDCDACVEYTWRLASAVSGLRDWATRTMIVPASPAGPVRRALDGATSAGVLVLADGDGRARGLLGLAPDQAAVVQADRWGAVYDVEAVGADAAGHDRLPSPEQLVSLAQYIDIQCPECGVPSKEWMSATPFPLG